MCGLPASGKDSWVREHRQGLPVVSYDDAREALGLKHGENDGKAAHHATDMAKALLRGPALRVERHAPEPADAIQGAGPVLRLQRRGPDRVLEQPREELLRRNGKRDTTLSNKALLGMLHRWELPVPSEAHEVRYEVEGAAA